MRVSAVTLVTRLVERGAVAGAHGGPLGPPEPSYVRIFPEFLPKDSVVAIWRRRQPCMRLGSLGYGISSDALTRSRRWIKLTSPSVSHEGNLMAPRIPGFRTAVAQDKRPLSCLGEMAVRRPFALPRPSCVWSRPFRSSEIAPQLR